MWHRARSDLRLDGLEARRSQASQWAASHVAPPMLMSARFLAGGVVALPIGFLGFIGALVAEQGFDARDWPPYVGLGGLALVGVGLITIFVSLACGAAKGRRCELACYGEGDKELACVNAKGELVSHLDGRSLNSHEAVKLGWWIVDTFSDTTPSRVEPSGDADALRGTGGVDVNRVATYVGRVGVSKILNVNERWYPVGGSHGWERAPVTVVLVEGDIGDYAAYVGVGDKSHAEDIARFGDKISFEEARCHFPWGLDETKYRA